MNQVAPLLLIICPIAALKSREYSIPDQAIVEIADSQRVVRHRDGGSDDSPDVDLFREGVENRVSAPNQGAVNEPVETH